MLLYAKTSLGAVKLEELCVKDQQVENIFINFSFVVGNFYRPLNSSFDIFIEIFSSILNILTCEHPSSNMHLMDDFNLYLLKMGVNSKYLEYYSIVSSYGYSPSILRPTVCVYSNSYFIEYY